MRIALAEIVQETDSFSPLFTARKDFESYGLYFGQEIIDKLRGVGPIGAFIELAERDAPDMELIPLVRAWGNAGGAITAGALRYLLDELTTRLQAALPVDAVYLSLHGAAASPVEDDVEGLVLSRVRDVVGPSIPVVVALDHHANITQRMVDLATALVGHETQPHDPPATGRKAGRLLLRQLRGEIRVTSAWRKIPMITPQDQFLTSQGPMKVWFDSAREIEQRPRVLDASPYPMQPWLDVAEGGWSVVVHTNDDRALAESLADELADQAWSLREQFWASERVAPQEAVRQADAASEGLTILSDTGDSVYGGAPGDSTVLLRALLNRPTSGIALVPMVDPEALKAVLTAGVGADVSLSLGAKLDCVFSQPVNVTGRVLAVSQGFQVDLGDRGVCDLQQTALLGVGSIRIALLGHRSFAINHPILYQHLGVDIADAKMVVLKTASNFQFFSSWRRGLIRVDSPGTTQSDLTAFHWQRLPRPTYPLDERISRVS